MSWLLADAVYSFKLISTNILLKDGADVLLKPKSSDLQQNFLPYVPVSHFLIYCRPTARRAFYKHTTN